MPDQRKASPIRQAGNAAAKALKDRLAEPDVRATETRTALDHGHSYPSSGDIDWHAHAEPNGDVKHGHTKRDGLLGRDARPDDWVDPKDPIFLLDDDVTQPMPPAGSEAARRRLNGLHDPAAAAPNAAATEVDPHPAGAAAASGDAPAVAAGSGRPTALQVASAFDRRDRLAAVERKIRARLAEVELLVGLQDLIDSGAHDLDIGDLVGAEVVRQAKQTINNWADARGVTP